MVLNPPYLMYLINNSGIEIICVVYKMKNAQVKNQLSLTPGKDFSFVHSQSSFYH